MTEYRLGDICKIINGRAYKQSELLNSGKYPVLRVGNFFSSDRWFYSDLELPADKYCSNGDLLFAWSASFGPRIWDGDKVIYHYHIWKLEPNEDFLDKYYLYYWLRQSVNILKAGIHGSVMAHITKRDMENQHIVLPNIDIQRRVASVLCGLDNKMAINKKINDNLADLLQAIYQEHFGNVSSTAIQGKLSDLCSYSKDRVSVSALDTDTYFSTENMLSGKIGATQATRLPMTSQTTACHKGDTLVSNIRPYFKKIVYCEEDCGCSSDVLCFTPIRSKYSAYIFSTLYADEFFNFMIAGSKGTKMPRGDKQQIMSYPVTLPSDDELDEFNSLALPILAQLHSKKAENKRLSTTRDALLPKLMSGEIDVASVQL